ncbi:MAG: hypothetical protein WB680_22510 [Candidatus Acidiferrales bacterium]
MFTQTIPLPAGGGVFEALEVFADLAGFAGAAAGAGAVELAAGGGVASAEAGAEVDFELSLEVDAVVLVFLLRLFFAGVVEDSSVAGALEESVDAGFALASAEVFFDRDFFGPVDVSAVAVDAVAASLEEAFDDLEDRDFSVPAESAADSDFAEVSVAADLEDLDFFALLAEAPLFESAVSFEEASADAVFFLDLLTAVPVELSFPPASELAEVFLDFFFAVVLPLLLASDC